jgi:uncharacterized RDD family membrane protein YckC
MPPVSAASTSSGRFTPAGHWKRFFAYVIDYLVLFFSALVIGWIAGLFSFAGHGAFPGGVLFLFACVLPLVYVTVLQSRPSGASWGKAALGLRVVTVGGERVMPIHAFIRCLLTYLIPLTGFLFVGLSAAPLVSPDLGGATDVGAVALAIGVLAACFGPYLTVFFNAQQQTLFDHICKTCVIRVK